MAVHKFGHSLYLNDIEQRKVNIIRRDGHNLHDIMRRGIKAYLADKAIEILLDDEGLREARNKVREQYTDNQIYEIGVRVLLAKMEGK